MVNSGSENMWKDFKDNILLMHQEKCVNVKTRVCVARPRCFRVLSKDSVWSAVLPH